MNVSFLRLQIDAGAVDAVPNPCLILRSIVENVSQVTITVSAPHFCPLRSKTKISHLVNFRALGFIIERWPSTMAIKLSLGSEEVHSTNQAIVFAWGVTVIVLIWVRRGLLLKGGSVADSWVTLYCRGVSLFLRSSLFIFANNCLQNTRNRYIILIMKGYYSYDKANDD